MKVTLLTILEWQYHSKEFTLSATTASNSEPATGTPGLLSCSLDPRTCTYYLSSTQPTLNCYAHTVQMYIFSKSVQ